MVSVRCMIDADTFPARSVARTTRRFKPGLSKISQEKPAPESVAGNPLHATESRPERASVAVPVTVKLAAEKAARSAGELTMSAGFVLSTLRVTLAVAEFPAASTTVPEKICPLPSVEAACGPGQVTMDALPAVQLNVTVVFKLVQPPPLGDGETTAVMPGRVVVAVTVSCANAAMFP